MELAEVLLKKLQGRNVLILGFGREGQSSYTEIRKILPDQLLSIADERESVRDKPLLRNDPELELFTGKGYLDKLESFDIIIKSPGISLKDHSLPPERITSQTALFLDVFSDQVTGITGTKGKSTTATLAWHILKEAGKDVLLLGNIGRPAFNFLEKINPGTEIIFEMSSHQLEYIEKAPHTAVLLNIFQEHLDAYRSFRDYQLAKLNICRKQREEDILIYNMDDPLILQHLAAVPAVSVTCPFSLHREPPIGSFVRDNRIFYRDGKEETEIYNLGTHRKLRGEHNVRNMLAAVNISMIRGIPVEVIADGITEFKGLEHRLEYAGTFSGIEFYDDSISTIPEACMEAVKTIGNADTLILGGFDRGIDYSGLAEFLVSSGIRNFIFMGDAGQRIRSEMEKFRKGGHRFFTIRHFDEFPAIVEKYTERGRSCLLSPAASSYNEFHNFEERGSRFQQLVKENFLP